MTSYKYVLISLLLLSITLNVLCLYFIHTSFTKIQYSRVFPLGFNFIPPFSENLELKQPTNLLMLGDSRISMWPEKFISDDIEVLNMAHGGQTSSQVLAQIQVTPPPKGNTAFVQVCINDIHSLKVLPNFKSQIIEQCKRNILKITEILELKGYKVILSTLYPPNSIPFSRKLFWPEDFRKIFDEINSFIKKQESSNITVLDAFSRLKQEDSYYLREEYIDDDFFLHINKSAYKKLSVELNKILFQF